MTKVLVSIGSNLENPEHQLEVAVEKLSQAYPDLQMSLMYLTEPVGKVAQDPFINAVMVFDTEDSADEVLEQLHDLEMGAGRNRDAEISKGPRVLDLDIILFGSEIWRTERLQIPHPRYQERRFVLVPAAELAPDMQDPVTLRTIRQTLERCHDLNWIKPLEAKALAG